MLRLQKQEEHELAQTQGAAQHLETKETKSRSNSKKVRFSEEVVI